MKLFIITKLLALFSLRKELTTIMASIPQEEALSQHEPSVQTWHSRLQLWRSQLPPWLFSWEMYLIILIAGFLRLYRFDVTQFDIDQANIYRLAYDAVHHGLLPVTATLNSVKIMNPPGIIYIMMLPAAFSPDPRWGVLMMEILGLVAVLLTYIFVRRYYGRLAGTLSALCYATFFQAVDYSRLIWNLNLLALFAPIFMFLLFRGVVDRRKGWFFPAAVLLGLIVQLHTSSGLLAVALLVAVVLAPGTIRWRELVFAGLALLILYLPFVIWEWHAQFSDLSILLKASGQPAHLDNQALFFYQQYIVGPSPDGIPQSVVYPLLPLIDLVNNITTPLLVLAVVMVCDLVLWPRKQGQRLSIGLWGRLRYWWSDFRADTYRCGLLLLLIWQLLPLIVFSHHSLPIYLHYFIFLMPGQYILIALLLTRVIGWLQKYRGQVGRVVAYAFVILIIAVQGASTLGHVVDSARGNFNSGHAIVGGRIDGNSGYGYRNVLNDMENAFAEAEQVAQQHHLKHLYISDFNSFDFLSNTAYLAEHAPIATTLFNNKCIVLPNPADGPALFLEGPYNDFTDELLHHFASATLVGEPKRAGEDPYKLYIVDTHPATVTVQASFTQDLQPLGTQQFSFQNAPWAITRWNTLRSFPMSFQTLYNYNLSNLGSTVASDDPAQIGQCFFTSMQAGDQLLVPFPLHSSSQTSLDIQITSVTLTPRNFTPHWLQRLGIPITFEVDSTAMDFPVDPTLPVTVLHTSDGKDHMIIPVPTQGTGGSK
ncbi:MAG: glycosyltransferase family 39 protein [Ktedonobacteraceae bacterium]